MVASDFPWFWCKDREALHRRCSSDPVSKKKKNFKKHSLEKYTNCIKLLLKWQAWQDGLQLHAPQPQSRADKDFCSWGARMVGFWSFNSQGWCWGDFSLQYQQSIKIIGMKKKLGILFYLIPNSHLWTTRNVQQTPNKRIKEISFQRFFFSNISHYIVR